MSDATNSDTGKKRPRGRPRRDSVPIMLRVPPDIAADLDRVIADREKMGANLTRQELIRGWIENELMRYTRKWAREDERKGLKARK